MNRIEIIASIAGGLEVLLRSIKTKRNFAPLAIIIDALSRVSKFLNNEKK